LAFSTEKACIRRETVHNHSFGQLLKDEVGENIGIFIRKLDYMGNYRYFQPKTFEKINIGAAENCAILGVFRETISDSIE